MKSIYISIFLMVLVVGCGNKKSGSKDNEATEQSNTEMKVKPGFDLQGHRGARGLVPENSLVAFERAMDLSVNTLELDVVISKDKKVVVSHEPWMSAEICLDRQGKLIEESEQRNLNLYEMDYGEIRQFNCGSLMHNRFPSQGKVQTHKPLLSEVFSTVLDKANDENKPIPNFNIEIKSDPAGDNLYHPEPDEFSDLVYNLVSEYDLWEKVNIQSFDLRVLQYYNQTYPEVRLALLIESEPDWWSNVDSLGFNPEIYSCHYSLLTEEIVGDLQAAGMKVIPWTVNQREDMIRLMRWSVDGIITDYPNIAVELLKEN